MKRTQVIMLCALPVIMAIGILFLVKNMTGDNKPEEATNKVINNNPTMSNEQQGIYDEIINKYLKTNDNEVVDTNFRFFEKRNVLIETKFKTGFSKFDIYNAETKEYHSLPSMTTIMKFHRFNSENEIVFLSDGTDTVSNFREFPYIIKCVKSSGKSEYEIKTEPLFLDVSQEVVLGRNGGNVAAFEILSKEDGIEIAFKAASSNKMEFSIPFASIPITRTVFTHQDDNNTSTKRLIFNFENTQFDASISQGPENNSRSEYFERLEWNNESHNSADLSSI